MSSTNLLKILFLLFVAFAIGEIVFITQRYGLPQFNLLKPKPGSCKILEEKYCFSGKFINGGQYIGFKNLPTGTPIFSLTDGQHETARFSNDSQFRGSFLSIFSSNRNAYYDFIGDLDWNTNPEIRKGDVIGSISSTGTKNFGEYNLIFSISRRNSSTQNLEPDNEGLKKLFSH